MLDEFGYDLANFVDQHGLPTIDLDINSPTIRGYKFLDFLLWTLAKPMNSVFLIGDDVSYINTYINSLALLLAQPEKMAERIRDSVVRMNNVRNATTPTLDHLIDGFIHKLMDKRLHTLDIKKLLSVAGEDHDSWDNIFSNHITNEVQEKNYFLVVTNLNELFKLTNKDKFHYQALSVFFATRGKVKLTFLAPLTWEDYVSDVERGIFPLLIQHRTPILFSPRPSYLPEPSIEKLKFDSDFVFLHNN